MRVTTMTAEDLAASGLVPHVRNKFAAYRWAQRHPETTFRDGRRVVFVRERIEKLLLGGGESDEPKGAA